MNLLLSPDVENRDLLERIYDNNIRKFKQNEVIKRINRMKQKLADYTDFRKKYPLNLNVFSLGAF